MKKKSKIYFLFKFIIAFIFNLSHKENRLVDMIIYMFESEKEAHLVVPVGHKVVPVNHQKAASKVSTLVVCGQEDYAKLPLSVSNNSLNLNFSHRVIVDPLY